MQKISLCVVMVTDDFRLDGSVRIKRIYMCPKMTMDFPTKNW